MKDRQIAEMTPNQVVAWNLREARRLRGWTQAQAAEALEPYVGSRWSSAVFSAAEEGSISGKRIRQFTADDIVAFSMAFDLPISWFFLPPREVTTIQVGKAPNAEVWPVVDFLQWLLSDLTDSVGRRIRKVVETVHPSSLEPWLQTLDLQKARLVREVLNAHMLNVRELRDELRQMAGRVDDALGELKEQHDVRGTYAAEDITEATESLDRPVADTARTRAKAIERLQAAEDRLRDVLRRASDEPLSEDDIERQIAQFRQSVGEVPTAKEPGEVESPRRGEETRR